jgi:hypothetical protein
MNMNNLFNKVIHGRQFNFQPLEFGNETGYHVDVKDDEGTRWEFRMLHKVDEQLKIEGEKLPEWITGSEALLVNAVNQHE